MHIAVLDANTDDSAFAARHPDDGAKFRALLHQARPDWQVSTVAVKHGVFPGDPGEFDGYIVTGSPSSVNDPLPWIEPLAALIRAAEARHLPVFGACFGHQMVARALGGRVAPNPGGWVFQRIETDLTTPWDGAKHHLSLYAAHSEQVHDLPPDVTVTGHTPGCPLAGLARGRHLWTTQYHPEMTTDFFTALVAEYGPKLPPEVAARGRASLDRPADEAVMARLIVAFFQTAHAARQGG